MSNQAYTATDRRIEIGGVAVWLCAPQRSPLASERSATDLIGEVFGSGARLVAIPVARLGPGFLTIGTRIAGEFIQKFVNYGFQVAFVGDVADAVAASDALRDFIRESNRGRHVWFVPDLAALEVKIAAAA
jgi:hypothetical protein